MTTSVRWDGPWLKIIEDLLAGDKDARATTWRRVFQHIEHLVRLDIGPLSDDKEVRRDIAVRVLGKLEANEHRNLRAWVDRQRRGIDSCSWWGFINMAARRCAIDHARTSSRNLARRGEPFRWVRVEPEDPAVLAERLDSSTELSGCCTEDLYRRLVRFQASRGTIRSGPPLPPPSVSRAPHRPRRDRS